MDIKIVSCCRCEGTGKELNTFDSRELSIGRFGERRTTVRNPAPRSQSGYLLMEDECKDCHGTGKVMELQPAEDRNVGGKSLAMRMGDLIVAGAKWDTISN